MYTTSIGRSTMHWDSREAAYRAAYDAARQGWHYINIEKDGELECQVILKSDGGIIVWTPLVENKWECSRLLGSVNDVVFR